MQVDFRTLINVFSLWNSQKRVSKKLFAQKWLSLSIVSVFSSRRRELETVVRESLPGRRVAPIQAGFYWSFKGPLKACPLPWTRLISLHVSLTSLTGREVRDTWREIRECQESARIQTCLQWSFKTRSPEKGGVAMKGADTEKSYCSDQALIRQLNRVDHKYSKSLWLNSKYRSITEIRYFEFSMVTALPKF